MRRLILITCVFLHAISYGQSSIDFGEQVQVRINSNGIFAIDQSDLSPACSASVSGFHYLKQMGVWISARDENETLHTAVQTLLEAGKYDFSYGPLDTIASQPDTSGWNKVWKLSAAEIAAHRSNYKQDGYTVPASISNWPGQHTGDNFISHLAPFADVNQNEQYDPENGDYPYIKGDEAVYVICNDNSFEHKVSGGVPLGLEFHIMVYRYHALPSTLFMEYYLINRLDFNYHDLRIGFFMEGQCGNPDDNYAATLKSENTLCIYNGDALDEGAFEASLPFVYLRFLNKELAGSLVFDKSTDSKTGFPTSAGQFDHFLHDKWRDGSERYFGGQGLDSTFSYAFMYVGNSDPDVDTWSESSAGNIPGERIILGYYRYAELPENNFLKMDIALGFGHFDSLENAESVVNISSTNSREFYDQTTGFGDLKREAIVLYPNPASDHFIVKGLEAGVYEFKVADIQGNIIENKEIRVDGTYRCNILLVPGVYLVEFNRNGRMIKKTLIVQP